MCVIIFYRTEKHTQKQLIKLLPSLSFIWMRISSEISWHWQYKLYLWTDLLDFLILNAKTFLWCKIHVQINACSFTKQSNRVTFKKVKRLSRVVISQKRCELTKQTTSLCQCIPKISIRFRCVIDYYFLFFHQILIQQYE